MIALMLNVAAISLKVYKIKDLTKKSSFIMSSSLLQK